jgi:hypothetical protein
LLQAAKEKGFNVYVGQVSTDQNEIDPGDGDPQDINTPSGRLVHFSIVLAYFFHFL